jgi:hypothetical protein
MFMYHQFLSAVKVQPTLVCTDYAFSYNVMHKRGLTLPDIAKDIDKLLATIRGAFLTARSRIPLSKLGGFVIGVAHQDGGRLQWMVSGAPPQKCIITVLCVNGMEKLLYRDAWEGEYK